MSRKTFVTNTVLTAADVQNFLMDQTVMSFPTSAARGSAIPSPTLGMYTHLEDAPPRTQFWNGSAWISPFGLTLISSTNFTTSTLVRLNDTFSATYDNYLVFFNVSSSASNPVGALRYLTATDTPTTTSTYNRTGFFSAVGSLGNYSANSEANGIASVSGGNNGSSAMIYFSNPFLTQRTGAFINIIQHDSTTRYDIVLSEQSNTSFSGFQVVPNVGTITGNVKVYGIRN